MKRAIVLLIILLSLAGCSHSGNSREGAIEKEVCPVVDSYLENAAAGNWQGVFDTLTGEALAGAKANAGQVKATGEKIIYKKLRATRVSEDIAKVSADFTVSSGGDFNRIAYIFDLVRNGDGWRIYKMSWGEYLHDDLIPGQLPTNVAGVIREYLEMPYADKKAKAHLYLSGKLFQDSEKSKALPVETKTYGVLQKTVTTVKSLECLGLSDDYAVVKAACSVERDGAAKDTSFLIETVFVNGTWKIAGIEIL